ncbi:hypothetical protein COCC4DRAFT_75475 [Bipolaris maydis ATCC 48331]|uniref:Uncharacterized protein n=2 Tax=Cochliobolus heterostrophus TaxID=5016 RepID=M2TCA9_COCH5|nr:uncharacterized protein COCC4DRAFT_75475 [Bipolaris maydis ATCC 48331]EMD95175.1 hypothetical protein COCHEDRAFT_1191900 [Bipolaris maydis C5]ENI00932.1 hypothetical protein COCC4DRAFT_75475 [Bipolaris maydis ATCC 48331]
MTDPRVADLSARNLVYLEASLKKKIGVFCPECQPSMPINSGRVLGTAVVNEAAHLLATRLRRHWQE